MAIDHSSCAHPRTPAGRSACRRAMAHISEHDAPAIKQARQMTVERSAKRHPSNVTHTRQSSSSGSLKALSNAPARVRIFVERCEVYGFEIKEMPVDQGFSIEVHSSRGAGCVTWDGEAVQWFTRLGYTSITSRAKNVREVWKVLGIPLDD